MMLFHFPNIEPAGNLHSYLCGLLHTAFQESVEFIIFLPIISPIKVRVFLVAFSILQSRNLLEYSEYYR